VRSDSGDKRTIRPVEDAVSEGTTRGFQLVWFPTLLAPEVESPGVLRRGIERAIPTLQTVGFSFDPILTEGLSDLSRAMIPQTHTLVEGEVHTSMSEPSDLNLGE